jgi:hypothetical protein
MTIPELPQDIIDTIVQAFAEIVLSDKDQLKKLCLVSHAFVPQSQRCIFRTISLLRDGYRDPNPPYHPFGERINVLGRKLHALLQTSPHLFAYVRVLKIHAWSSAELAWVASMGEEAAAIIHACPALQTLELGSEAPIEWAVVHPSLQTSLVSRIQSTQLDDLTLINLQDIPNFLLSTLGSLSTLRLENVSFSTPEGQQFSGSKKTRSRSPLQRLCKAESNPVIRLLLDDKILSSELIALDIRYGHNGEDASLMHNLLHQVQGIREFHVVLQPNGKSIQMMNLNFFGFLILLWYLLHCCRIVLAGLKCLNIAPLQNLRRISILTRQDTLHETYTFMKHVITTSTTLETAVVMLAIVDDGDWSNYRYLDALHLWTDFDPDPPFQKLTLSFVIPQTLFHVPIGYWGGGCGFRRKLTLTTVGAYGNDGNQQLLSHIILGKVLINYVYIYDNVIWEESLRIRRRVFDTSIGRVYWRTWETSIYLSSIRNTVDYELTVILHSTWAPDFYKDFWT